MAHHKKLEQEVAFDDFEQRFWKRKLDQIRGGLAISAFFMVICFVLCAFLGLFQYDTTPGTLDTRGLSFPVYWCTFLGYVCWKFYEKFVWRNHIQKRKSVLTIRTLPKELTSVLFEIIHLKRIQVLFIFGLLYSILLLILGTLKI